MNLLVEDGLDAEVQAQAEQICGTYLGTSDFYTSSKTQRALDRERLTDATMLIVYSLTALFGIIGISSAAEWAMYKRLYYAQSPAFQKVQMIPSHQNGNPLEWSPETSLLLLKIDLL